MEINKRIVGTTIYLCRHGESEANVRDIIGGNYDITKNGVNFGYALGKYIKQEEVVEKTEIPIWTSTLKRTINTALKCQEASGGKNKLLQWKELDEIHGGMCEEHTFDYVKKNHPEIYLNRKIDKFNFVYPGGGESYAMLSKRIEPVILSLERQSTSILIICHTAVLRLLLAYLLDLDVSKVIVKDVPLNRVYKITKDDFINSCNEIDLEEHAS
jgi:6-phosphofructo-2-kinase/fructose-2,6-biphosphatase 2